MNRDEVNVMRLMVTIDLETALDKCRQVMLGRVADVVTLTHHVNSDGTVVYRVDVGPPPR